MKMAGIENIHKEPIQAQSPVKAFGSKAKSAFKAAFNWFEPAVWSIALIALYFMEPGGSHFSLCPLHNVGISFCPGCGLGHSLHYLMHFQLKASFVAHPLGWFAFIVLIHRIGVLIFSKFSFKSLKPLKL